MIFRLSKLTRNGLLTLPIFFKMAVYDTIAPQLTCTTAAWCLALLAETLSAIWLSEPWRRRWKRKRKSARIWFCLRAKAHSLHHVEERINLSARTILPKITCTHLSTNLPILSTTSCNLPHITDTRLCLKPRQELVIIKSQLLQKAWPLHFWSQRSAVSTGIDTALPSFFTW